MNKVIDEIFNKDLYEKFNELTPDIKESVWGNDFEKFKSRHETIKEIDSYFIEDNPGVNINKINSDFEKLNLDIDKTRVNNNLLETKLDFLIRNKLGLSPTKTLQDNFNFDGHPGSKIGNKNTYYIDRVYGEKFAGPFEDLKDYLRELGFETIELDDQYNRGKRNVDYWGNRGFGPRGQYREHDKVPGGFRVLNLQEDLKRKQFDEQFNNSFAIDEDGQITIKDAQPNPIEELKNDTNNNITKEITPSFIDENGEIKSDYISKAEEKIENETKVIIEPNESVQIKEETKNTEEKEVKNNKEQAGKNTSKEAHKAEETAKNAESKPTKELEPVDYIDVESKNVEEKPQQQVSSETIEQNKTEETKPSTEEKETKKSESVKQKENNTKETSNNSTSTEKPNTSNSEPTREPSIDVNNTKDVRTTKPIYTTNTEPKINTKVIGQEAKEALEKGVEKHLKGTGIIAAAAIVGGLFIHHKHEKEKENRNIEPDYLTVSSRRKIFWNQNNTARLAKDVSSYRYGSRMSGYV